MLGKKKPRSQRSQRITADFLLIVFAKKNSVMNHQVPSMAGRHVSNPLTGLGTTCPLMKMEERIKRR